MRRRVLVIVLAVLLLPVAAAVAAWAIIDPDAWRPEIAAAARRASGREVALNGPIALTPSFWPTVSASDVVLTGRGQTIAIARVEARLALLPLLSRRIEVSRLTLIRPTLTMVPFVPPQTAAAAPSSSHAGGSSPALFVAQLRIEDGQVVRGPGAVLAIRRLDAVAASAASPVAVDADLAWNGMAFQAHGEVGSLAQLRRRDPASPWPVRLSLTAADGHGSVVGDISDPLHRRGYRLKLDASLADTGVLRDVLPASLPALHDVTLAATIADQGGRVPSLSDLAVTAGAMDLGRLKLDTLSVTQPQTDGPLRVQAAGVLDGVKVSMDASLDGALLTHEAGPAKFDVKLAAETATLSFKGAVAKTGTVSGAAASLSGRIPDLAALAPMLRAKLPAWHDIAFDTMITTDADGLFVHGLALRELSVRLPQGAITGEMTVSPGARPNVQATLAATRIDLDALLAALPPRPPKPVGSAAPPVAGQPGERRTRLIPDTRLPFSALSRLDAKVALQVAELIAGGATTRDLSVVLTLQDGRLSADPVTGQLPGGRLEAALHVDARQDPTPVSLVLRAPGLAIGPLLAAFGLPGSNRGALEVDADLRGAGDTPRALAAGLDGHLGLAMVDGAIDNRLLEALGAPLLRAGRLPVDLGGGRAGGSEVRCLAMRLDAASGVVAVKTLLLDMKALRAEGSGEVDLGDEALDLRLKPLLRLSATGIMVPLHVSGTLLAPKVQVDAPGGVGQAVEDGLGAGKGGAFSAILGALTTEPVGAQACGEQLALARGGRAGPMPADPPPGAEKKPPKPADLLRQLFR